MNKLIKLIILIAAGFSWLYSMEKPGNITFLEYLNKKQHLSHAIQAADQKIAAETGRAALYKVQFDRGFDLAGSSLCSNKPIDPRLYFPTTITDYNQSQHGKSLMQLFRVFFDYDDKKEFYVPDQGEKIKVLFIGSMQIGFVTYSCKEKGTAHIEYLAVDPRYQQNWGFGTALLNHVKADARVAGIKRITTNPLTKSTQFFVNKGFVKYHPQLQLYHLLMS